MIEIDEPIGRKSRIERNAEQATLRIVLHVEIESRGANPVIDENHAAIVLLNNERPIRADEAHGNRGTQAGDIGRNLEPRFGHGLRVRCTRRKAQRN